MRWFWLWRLRVANRRLSKALANLPSDYYENPVDHAAAIIEWARAHVKIIDILEHLQLPPDSRHFDNI